MRPRVLSLPVLSSAILTLLLLAAAPEGAAAQSGQFRWSTLQRVAPGEIKGISCSSESLCASVTSTGSTRRAILVSTDPRGGHWSRERIPLATHDSLAAVSCAAGLCVVVSRHGEVLASTDPATPGSWLRRILPGSPRQGLEAVDCVSSTFCVAAGTGSIFVSTNPSDPEASWAETRLRGRRLAHTTLDGMDCPSVTRCFIVLGGYGGRFLVTDRPTGGATAWKQVRLPRAGGLGGVSCPRVTRCYISGTHGEFFTMSGPPARASSWKRSSFPQPSFITSNLSCPTVRFCGVSGFDRVFASPAPARGRASWRWRRAYKPIPGLERISCPSPRLCVAAAQGHLGRRGGNVVIGSRR